MVTDIRQRRNICKELFIHTWGKDPGTVAIYKRRGRRHWCFMNITVSLHINVKSLRQMNFLIEYACRIDGLGGGLSVTVSSTLCNEFQWWSRFQIGQLKTDVQPSELLSSSSPSGPKRWSAVQRAWNVTLRTPSHRTHDSGDVIISCRHKKT